METGMPDPTPIPPTPPPVPPPAHPEAAVPPPLPHQESPTSAAAPVEPIPAPLPPPFRPVELPAGEELLNLRFRPDLDGLLGETTPVSLQRLNRAGLPAEQDDDGWPMPEFQLGLTLIPKSSGWYGEIYDGSLDIPVSRNDSLRATVMVGSFNDSKDSVELEATVLWQRVTVEYERRLAGYTRSATFDLAVRVGVEVDGVRTHDAAFLVDSAVRASPWIGVEAALWERDGVGLVVQAGHSFAVRLSDAAMSSTDIKGEFRIDLSETVSLEVGWRYVAVRIHDKGSSGGLAYQELEQSFSGPVGGLSLRF
jgi:hypothetical protein